MKRVFILLIVIVLIIPYSACAKSTDRCYLIEFVERFTRRITEYQRDNNMDVLVIPLLPMVYKRNEFTIFESTAGSIKVYTDDYMIHDVMVTIATTKGSQSDFNEGIIRAVTALSALEINDTVESTYKLLGSTAMDMAMVIANEFLGAKFTEYISQSASSGSRVKVYEGNYNYFILCQFMDDVMLVHMIAEEHE